MWRDWGTRLEHYYLNGRSLCGMASIPEENVEAYGTDEPCGNTCKECARLKGESR